MPSIRRTSPGPAPHVSPTKRKREDPDLGSEHLRPSQSDELRREELQCPESPRTKVALKLEGLDIRAPRAEALSRPSADASSSAQAAQLQGSISSRAQDGRHPFQPDLLAAAPLSLDNGGSSGSTAGQQHATKAPGSNRASMPRPQGPAKASCTDENQTDEDEDIAADQSRPRKARLKSPPPPSHRTSLTGLQPGFAADDGGGGGGGGDDPLNHQDAPFSGALTWRRDEITGHDIDPTCPDDDGEGINGVGFRPTAAIAYARSQKRKQQVNEWRAREAREARQKRFERRRGRSDAGDLNGTANTAAKVRFAGVE